MVRRKNLMKKLPASLVAHAASRSSSAFEKLEKAKILIEADVAAGIVQPKDVTLKMLLVDRAGLNHRFLDRDVYADRKVKTLQWVASLKTSKVPQDASHDDRIAELQGKITALELRLEKMSDRVHFFSSRIRELQRANRQLKAKSLETVVYLRDSEPPRLKTP